jgi:hypothetical protein
MSDAEDGRYRSRLTGCGERLRHARGELEKVRTWLEARAVHLDKVIGDLTEFLDGSTPPPGSRTASSNREPALSSTRIVRRSDGFFDVYLDAVGPLSLPPTLGRLFQLLADDNGHAVDDALVGFKSNGYLMEQLNTSARTMRTGAEPRTHGRVTRLNQAISDLRSRLSLVRADSRWLLQTRRGVGFRIAVRKPDRP